MGKAAMGLLGLLGGGGILAAAAASGYRYFSDVLELIDAFYELPSTEEELKKEIEVDKCIKHTFPGLASLEKANLEDVGDESKLGTTGEPNGCLAINWDRIKGKEDGNKDKWRGNFRFLWTFARENTGFLIYFTADTPETPPTSNPKLKAKGMAYVLTKDAAKNTWSISKGKKIDKDWEVSKLPKMGKELVGEKKVEESKFAKDDEDLSKLCSWSDCPYNPVQENPIRMPESSSKQMKKLVTKGPLSNHIYKMDEWFRGWWTWTREVKDKETKVSPDKWSTNLTEWWKEIYDENGKWKMEDVLKGIEGQWKDRGMFIETPSSDEKDKPTQEAKPT